MQTTVEVLHGEGFEDESDMVVIQRVDVRHQPTCFGNGDSMTGRSASRCSGKGVNLDLNLAEEPG